MAMGIYAASGGSLQRVCSSFSAAEMHASENRNFYSLRNGDQVKGLSSLAVDTYMYDASVHHSVAMASYQSSRDQGIGGRRKGTCDSSRFASPRGWSSSRLTFLSESSQSQVSLDEGEEMTQAEVSLAEDNEIEEEKADQGTGEDSDDDDEPSAKVNAMLREAILKFTEEDLEEASKKYDMEEELFGEIDYAQINAFTDRPFGGNPAAVCYLPLKRSDEWLQLVAREFNLSETAFLMKRSTKTRKPSVKKEGNEPKEEDEFDLRWFTPKVEVALCGHATLASAHLLFSSGIAERDTILFHTKSGILRARKVSGYKDDGEAPAKEDVGRGKQRPTGVGVVELDFPLIPAMECTPEETNTLFETLGEPKILWAGKTSLGDYLVEVPSSKDVEQLRPEFLKMLAFDGRGGVIVTSAAEKDSGFDFVSRFFCPKAGINEDPVTGSAHCTLGPYWAARLGKTTLQAFQASDRGGIVTVRVESSEGRAYLQGACVLMMAGVLLNASSIGK